jgi:hypothetical protein
MRRNQMMPIAWQFGRRTASTAELVPQYLTIHRQPMTCLDSFSSMPDLHSPGGLEDLSQSTMHDEILVTSGEPTGGC